MIEKVKDIMIMVIVLIIVVGVIKLNSIYNQNRELKNENDILKQNEIAYISENDSLFDKNVLYQYTIDQINSSNDSLILKINELRKKLKIKDDEVIQFQYMLSNIQKSDTVIFRDTIFVDSAVNRDTLLKDDWYQLYIGIRYPNIIAITPKFKSEKNVIISYRKIKSDKKCRFFGFLKKKKKIVEVDVIENNPYIINNETKFIKIIK